MKERIAIIDLGTNTFHLFIVEVREDEVKTLYREKIAVKIGKDGISKGRISAAARKRALHALQVFNTLIYQFEVGTVTGVATSAIRSAKNGQQLLDDIKERTSIDIEIISGEREAELIFYGVKSTFELSETPQLVMDIGGGSVEFIIGNNTEIFWKQSFEIGAQRLLDKFHKEDPMPQSSIDEMCVWLETELYSLVQAINEFKPHGLIGCSGTFDTLSEIYMKKKGIERLPGSLNFQFPIEANNQIYQELLTKDRKQRMRIPGMVSMRVDMIVVASCLIQFVLKNIKSENITACSYALKEGLLYTSFSQVRISEQNTSD
ncbi:Ppx/GppA phosphatase family protein [Roseivirga echinicomitans]